MELIKKQAGHDSAGEDIEENLHQLVANIAHEFRTPLAIMLGHIDIILDGVTGTINKKQEQSLQKIKELALRLTRMATDILSVATVINGKIQLRREKIATPIFVNRVIQSLEYLGQKKKITLDLDVPQKISSFWGDPDRIEQCLTNIVENAVKFAHRDTEVHINVREEPESIRFEVKDQGQGIPEEEIEKIFNRFERSRGDNAEGFGLGLAITKEIIDLHRGRIWVESQPGKGSSFIFELPKDLRQR
ncbi:MAG: hypothetical protein A3I75_05260 [Deltaproteobacteria bacterium RIFCSPLOWO2_02_FULL_50_16]|nr:MAG: hypothetical protein A3B79_05665 [Deltaproteobacteria bacterium RIFCSPHIGHO2_02_FULL_50_15]OGQ57687.1 MAG: hypothetical protein A3I75_05260 [Deltaproteobacteria bacterium RIFCSPLOWO2_02_FULL_50_16]OGQ68451.1 MAG: hypothetical protein A3F89_04145 [Deltaproteobacteria bacterium RIFCSPLOWO2_12_FULL_50_11]